MREKPLQMIGILVINVLFTFITFWQERLTSISNKSQLSLDVILPSISLLHVDSKHIQLNVDLFLSTVVLFIVLEQTDESTWVRQHWNIQNYCITLVILAKLNRSEHLKSIEKEWNEVSIYENKESWNTDIGKKQENSGHENNLLDSILLHIRENCEENCIII